MLCYINPTEKWTYRYRSDAYMVEPVVSSGVTWRDYSKKRNNTFTHEQNNQGFESLNRSKPPPKPLTRHCQGHLWLETSQLKSCSRDLHLNGLVSAWHRNNNKCLCSHSCTLGEKECLVMGSHYNSYILSETYFRKIHYFMVCEHGDVSFQNRCSDMFHNSLLPVQTMCEFVCNLAVSEQTVCKCKVTSKFLTISVLELVEEL